LREGGIVVAGTDSGEQPGHPKLAVATPLVGRPRAAHAFQPLASSGLLFRAMIKRPRRWLKSFWVEQNSNAQGTAGERVFTTAAVDDAELFLWIRKMHYPHVTPKQYRNALRDLCMDRGPGYKASPLPEELRQVLSDRLQALGKKRWACQVYMLENPASSPELPPYDATPPSDGALDFPGPCNLEPDTQPPIASSAVAVETNAMNHFTARPIASSVAQVGANATSHVTAMQAAPLTQQLPTTLGVRTQGAMLLSAQDSLAQQQCAGSSAHMHSVEPTAKRVACDEPPEQRQDTLGLDAAQVTQSAGEHIDDLHTAWADQALVEGFAGGIREAESDDDDGDGEDNDFVLAYPDFSLAIETDVSELETVPATDEEFMRVFDDTMSKFHDFGLVSKSEYEKLEHHYTECFSHPSEVAFVVYFTDRHWVWRPCQHANARSIDILGVDVKINTLRVNRVETLRRIKEGLSVAKPGETVLVPDVLINCLDNLENPFTTRCDAWVPNVTLNGDEGIYMFARHGAAVLIREPNPTLLN
jgi:hypothetical protein